MKNKMNIKSILPIAMLVGALVFTGCKDDFSEKDFLDKQYELTEQKAASDHARSLALLAATAKSEQDLTKLNAQIAKEQREAFLLAYQNAGLLVKANIIVLDVITKKPVAGATVSLFGKEATTSTQGIASFTDVAIGAGDVKLSATNYYTATSPALIAYEKPAVAEGGLPLQRTISATMRMLANGSIAESAVMVKGKVTLDSDLTNPITESPKAIVIRIDYAAAMNLSTSSKGIVFSSYLLDSPDFGEAKVDPKTGAYAISVPAINDIKLILPETEEEITYLMKNPAYDANDKTSEKYLLKKETAVFKIDKTNTPDYFFDVPTSDLYTYEFDALKGSAFDLGFTQLFDNIYGSKSSNTNSNYTFTKGTGYTAIPKASLTAAGSDAVENDKIYVDASVEVNKLGFAGGDATVITSKVYQLEVEYIDQNGSKKTMSTMDINVIVNGTAITYTPTSNVAINISNISKINEFKLSGVPDNAQPNITYAFLFVDVKHINIIKGTSPKKPGTYTAAPIVTFTGGEPKIAAKFKFATDMESRWAVTIKNHGQDYEAMPDIKYTSQTGIEVVKFTKHDDEFNLDNTYTSLEDAFVLNTNGTITKNLDKYTDFKTGNLRPSEVATIIEDKISDSRRAKISFTYTTNNDKLNDIKDLNKEQWEKAYKTKPEHRMLKNYKWVKDVVTPLEFTVAYDSNGTAPKSIITKKGTGKGYMNPQAQKEVKNPNAISASDKGKTIVRNFAYGIGKLKE